MTEKETIKLPSPDTKGKMSFEETINKRQSVRRFSNKNLSTGQVSQLLWAAYGNRLPDAVSSASKTVPSAGAIYPMEVYLVSPEGFFKYGPEGHELILASKEDLRSSLAGEALGQSSVAGAAVNVVITTRYEDISSRYGKRGILYADIEAGHIAQNIHLQAVSLGLGTVPIGAFNPGGVQKLLKLEKNETPVYIIPVGYPK